MNSGLGLLALSLNSILIKCSSRVTRSKPNQCRAWARMNSTTTMLAGARKILKCTTTMLIEDHTETTLYLLQAQHTRRCLRTSAVRAARRRRTLRPQSTMVMHLYFELQTRVKLTCNNTGSILCWLVSVAQSTGAVP